MVMERSIHVQEQLRDAYTVQKKGLSKPMPSLPFEIVSSILFQFTSGWDDPYASETRVRGAHTIVHASQICRYWRSVALQLPKLWQTIINVDFNSAAWVQELLRRSGNLPLKIESNAEMDRSSEFDNVGYRAQKWGFVFKEMHRVRVFHLLFHRRAWDLAPLFQALIQPAPLMESIQVVSDAVEFGIEEDIYMRWPNRLFLGVAPQLREIVIQGIGIPRPFDMRNTKLTSLSISAVSDEPSLNESEWLDLLDNQPELSNLCIYDMNVYTPFQLQANQSAPHRQVFLPSLMFLFLTGQQGFVNGIFPKIVAPRNCGAYVLELTTFGSPEDQANDGILRGLASLFESMEKDMEEDRPCCAWKICCAPDSRLTIDAYTALETDDDPMFSISIDVAFDRNATISAIFRLLRAKGLMKEADTLKLKLTDDLNPETRAELVSLLLSCSKVSKLILMGEVTVYVVNSLSLDNFREPDPLAERDSPSTNLFPKLDVLVYNEDENEIRIAEEVLFSFLVWRSLVGMKIPRLWMCLEEPEYALSLFSRRPDLKALDVILKVTETEEWDVVPRTPFPSLS